MFLSLQKKIVQIEMPLENNKLIFFVGLKFLFRLVNSNK